MQPVCQVGNFSALNLHVRLNLFNARKRNLQLIPEYLFAFGNETVHSVVDVMPIDLNEATELLIKQGLLLVDLVVDGLSCSGEVAVHSGDVYLAEHNCLQLSQSPFQVISVLHDFFAGLSDLLCEIGVYALLQLLHLLLNSIVDVCELLFERSAACLEAGNLVNLWHCFHCH